jgi:hypothetical protein
MKTIEERDGMLYAFKFKWNQKKTLHFPKPLPIIAPIIKPSSLAVRIIMSSLWMIISNGSVFRND